MALVVFLVVLFITSCFTLTFTIFLRFLNSEIQSLVMPSRSFISLLTSLFSFFYLIIFNTFLPKNVAEGSGEQKGKGGWMKQDRGDAVGQVVPGPSSLLYFFTAIHLLWSALISTYLSSKSIKKSWNLSYLWLLWISGTFNALTPAFLRKDAAISLRLLNYYWYLFYFFYILKLISARAQYSGAPWHIWWIPAMPWCIPAAQPLQTAVLGTYLFLITYIRLLACSTLINHIYLFWSHCGAAVSCDLQLCRKFQSFVREMTKNNAGTIKKTGCV